MPSAPSPAGDAARNIVLTGASAGIGAALAAELAGPGRHFLLIGRDAGRLAATAEALRARGAGADTAAMSVTDREGMESVLRGFDAARPVDLVIANAGVAGGRDPATGLEPPGQSRRIVEVNLCGVFNTVEPLLPAMMARGRGHVVLISSLAGLRPQGDEPSYSASKAGVRGWGIAMRGWLRAHGVAVTVICPGFVTTEMSARYQGPKPFEWDVARAARRIARAIRKRKAEYAFPWQMMLLIRLDPFVPAWLSDRIERRLAAEIRPDPELFRDADPQGK
ncbi:MAG: SDR family NAD(P)-dependent oxidoreductase [Alphaproteobacteria bacterium]|nr:MAG: SDR family NAD(P)-dependent oxidoreductase [Alphaproteobacteria bacterium]